MHCDYIFDYFIWERTFFVCERGVNICRPNTFSKFLFRYRQPGAMTLYHFGYSIEAFIFLVLLRVLSKSKALISERFRYSSSLKNFDWYFVLRNFSDSQLGSMKDLETVPSFKFLRWWICNDEQHNWKKKLKFYLLLIFFLSIIVAKGIKINAHMYVK